MTEREPDPFEDFDKRLRDARGPATEEDDDGSGRSGGYGPGWQAGIDVFAGVLGGVLIGWALDRWFGTTPILLSVFLFVGAGAGVRNAFRTLQRLAREDDGR